LNLIKGCKFAQVLGYSYIIHIKSATLLRKISKAPLTVKTQALHKKRGKPRTKEKQLK